MRRLRQLALLLALALFGPALLAQDLLPVPPLSGRVIDQTGTLSGAQRDAMAAKLAAFEAASGPQIVVLLVPTTQPEDIAAYAQRVGEAWKIGRRAERRQARAHREAPAPSAARYFEAAAAGAGAAPGLSKLTAGGAEMAASFCTVKLGLTA